MCPEYILIVCIYFTVINFDVFECQDYIVGINIAGIIIKDETTHSREIDSNDGQAVTSQTLTLKTTYRSINTTSTSEVDLMALPESVSPTVDYTVDNFTLNSNNILSLGADIGKICQSHIDCNISNLERCVDVSDSVRRCRCLNGYAKDSRGITCIGL
jgi:hypothetical protein